MKRLTISMSDELFDKLDLIENKSLFIRKLIERELDILDNAPEDNISVPWTERVAILVDDVSTIFSRLELIERKFFGVNNTFENTQTPPDKINIQIPIEDNKIINDDPMLLIANEEEEEEEAYDIISIENGNTETILLPDTQSVTNEKVELIKPVTPNNEQIEQEFAAFGLTGQEPQMQVPDKVTEEKTFAIPELKLPEQAKKETEVVMPEFKLPEQAKQDTEFIMPELKLPEQAKQETEFIMPELKLPEQAKQEIEFVMPELKLPEQAKQETEFVMPDLTAPQVPDIKSSAGMKIFDLQETKTAPELPPFKIPEMQQPGNPGSVPPFMNNETCSMQGIQSTPAPTAPVIKQSTDTKPDKLEGNILMYMPRGAKVKKDIIKSLVSRQFSQEEVDRKIKELVAREVLVLKQENGIEHLHRLK